MLPKKKQKARSQRYGSVLVLMLIVMTISFVIGTTLMAMGEDSQLTAARQIEKLNAQTAADSGLRYALQEVNNAAEEGTLSNVSLPSDTNVPLPHSEATYSYTTTYSAIDGYQIECTGYYKDRSHTVRVKLGRNSLFEYGISCQTFLAINNGALVDAYDSRISDDPADCSEKITIGSQCVNESNIDLDMGAVIDGDIFCGPNLDANFYIHDSLATVTGNKYAMNTPPSYPIVSPPAIYGPGTVLTFTRTEKTMGPGGDYPENGYYSSVNMGVSSVLRVTGNCTLVVKDRVGLGAKSSIIIEEGASLKVYVGSGWNSGTDCDIVNLNGDPSSLCIIQTSDHMIYLDIQAKNDFSGVIYAPISGLLISTGSDFRGAVVSTSLKINNAGRFLYDVALKDFSLGDANGAFQIDRWSED